MNALGHCSSLQPSRSLYYTRNIMRLVLKKSIIGAALVVPRSRLIILNTTLFVQTSYTMDLEAEKKASALSEN